MELKPGYKQTEVGVIPEEWEVFSLSEITEPQRPISYGIVQTGPNIANGVRCLRVLDIHDGRINKTELITTSKEISEAYRRTVLRAGDLVMPLRGKVGDVGLVDADLQGANLTRGVALIAIRPGWSPEFCQHAISSLSTRSRLTQAMNGSALQEIPIASLRSFKISTPTALPEQRAIAAALSDVDGLLGGLDRLIAKKRDLKQAAMQQLLTGQTRLPGFDGEWEVKRLGDVAILKNGYAFKSNTYTSLGTFKIITIANVQDGYMTADACNTIASEPADLQPHQRLGRGDILISMTGNVGRVCRVDEDHCLLNQRVGKLVPLGIVEALLFVLLRQASFISAMTGVAKGGAQPNLSASDITEHTFNMPKHAPEQTAIAEVLTEMDAELAALAQQREKTRALKQAMMQELLTGRTRLQGSPADLGNGHATAQESHA
jgi:type I restriction enzyme S subunit